VTLTSWSHRATSVISAWAKPVRSSSTWGSRHEGSLDFSEGFGKNERVVFCDFDGPVVDVSQRYYRTYQIALARTRRHFRDQGIYLSVRAMSKSQFWRLKQARTPDEEIALRSGIGEMAFPVFSQTVRQVVNEPRLLRQDQIQPQLPWALILLQQHQIKVVLVTLRCQDQVLAILEQHGLGDRIAGVHGTQSAEAAYLNYADLKTQLLSQALAEHAPHGNHCCMIGDTEADVLAAQRLGIPAIALTCGIRSRAYLATYKPQAIHANLLVASRSLLAGRAA
jgi:phosphoglycolate phosphatase